jgi:CBS domain-containing protein
MSTQHNEPEVTGPATPVWRLMTRAVAKISPEARLDELARKLSAVEAGAMGVGSSDQLIGIVSERDLTRAYGRSADPGSARVSDIASTDLIWCAPDITAAEAARLMVGRHVRHLVVGEAGELEGIVSARDLIEALVGD